MTANNHTKGNTILIFRIIFIILNFTLLSCTQTTRVNDISNSRYEYLKQKLDEPILVGEKTVIFDSRSKLDYMMYSLPGAIHLTWQQLVNDSSIDNSVVVGDKAFYAARKLARLGVGPESEVVIIGRNEKGQAHAGRLAWSLLSLGFKNVQVVSLESLKSSLTAFKERKHKSIPIWKPTDSVNIEISKKEIANLLRERYLSTMIIDVRSDTEMKEMNLKILKNDGARFKSAYIPWTYFYNSKGRPDKSFLNRLKGNDVTMDKNIIVISNEGVRSAAVTFSLLSMGYKNVKNYSGGYKSLFKGR